MHALFEDTIIYSREIGRDDCFHFLINFLQYLSVIQGSHPFHWIRSEKKLFWGGNPFAISNYVYFRNFSSSNISFWCPAHEMTNPYPSSFYLLINSPLCYQQSPFDESFFFFCRLAILILMCIFLRSWLFWIC